MAYRGQGQKVQKVMVQPINLIFRYLQNRSRIQVWLYEQVNMRIEGCIIGFDEYMNLVLDDAEEIHSKTKSRKQLAGGTVFLCVIYSTNRNKFGEQGRLGVWGTVTLCHLSGSPEHFICEKTNDGHLHLSSSWPRSSYKSFVRIHQLWNSPTGLSTPQKTLLLGSGRR
ncbi:small nuclear ribonucleoprotein E isoform X3 [Panthera onca]